MAQEKRSVFIAQKERKWYTTRGRGTVLGVGKYKLSQYGDEFIFTIREYMDEHGIEFPAWETLLPKLSRKSAGTPSANGDTVMNTFKLYDQGKSIEDIAAERGLSQATIESNLVKAYNMGLTVDPDDFLPEEHRKAIFARLKNMVPCF